MRCHVASRLLAHLSRSCADNGGGVVGACWEDEGGMLHSLLHLLHQRRCGPTAAFAPARDTPACAWEVVALPPQSFVFARAPVPNAAVSSSLRSSEFPSCALNLDRSNLQARSAGAADQFVSLFVFATFQGRLVWPAFCHGIFFVQRDFVRDCIGRPFHVATLSFWVFHFVVRKHHEDAVRIRLEQRTRDPTKAEGAS